ncbi:hypothetical protein [Carnobacterium sp. ISL-102]|uniref:hypothetical protein n=1 Tax=Carnobacterium sp. ISL-102 TaxID=2819142 RepID=UPI001BE5A9DE|nr:hypothetical protein [Carnobacterium sp. ISL-102]MBT2731659.1 hypothetical protein [Carnobacterium sp. ISL-102]
MNLHEKVEQQYKVVEMFNSINDTTELFISELDDLLEEFKNGERDSISVANEMQEVIEHIRVSEYEKNTLRKVIKSI